MIDKTKLLGLTNKWISILTDFNDVIVRTPKKRFRNDLQKTSFIIQALQCIKDGTPFTPSKANGIGSISISETDPVKVLQELLVEPESMRDYLSSINFYYKDKAENIKRLHEFVQEVNNVLHPQVDNQTEYQNEYIIFCSASNNFLMVEFPSETLRNKALIDMGGLKKFPMRDNHLPGCQAVITKPDAPTCLYFNSYRAKNGELAIRLISSEVRNYLCKWLPAESFHAYDKEDTIYFLDQNINNGAAMSVAVPEYLYSETPPTSNYAFFSNKEPNITWTKQSSLGTLKFYHSTGSSYTSCAYSTTSLQSMIKTIGLNNSQNVTMITLGFHDQQKVVHFLTLCKQASIKVVNNGLHITLESTNDNKIMQQFLGLLAAFEPCTKKLIDPISEELKIVESKIPSPK